MVRFLPVTDSGLAKIFLWLLRVSIAILPIFGFDDFLPNNPSSVQEIMTWLAWLIWATTIVSVFVCHPLTLTVLRFCTPVIGVVLIVRAVSQHPTPSEIITAGIGGVIFLLSLSAEVGSTFVQASAYGDEQRFALRPPVALIGPVAIALIVFDAMIIASVLLLARRFWLLGLVLAFLTIGLANVIPKRVHQLTKRWLVFVPAGLVIHDATLLGANLMVKKYDLAKFQFAAKDTQSADLTGLTWGIPLDITFKSHADVSLTTITAKQLNALSIIHASAILVAPSRPGSVLRAAKARHLPAN